MHLERTAPSTRKMYTCKGARLNYSATAAAGNGRLKTTVLCNAHLLLLFYRLVRGDLMRFLEFLIKYVKSQR